MKWRNDRAPAISGKTKEAVADFVLDYVKRNPGKQIPNAEIGKMYGVKDYQVQTVKQWLVRLGKLNQISSYIYEIPKAAPVQQELPTEAQPVQLTAMIESLAMTYVWQTGDHDLRKFIEWTKDLKSK